MSKELFQFVKTNQVNCVKIWLQLQIQDHHWLTMQIKGTSDCQKRETEEDVYGLDSLLIPFLSQGRYMYIQATDRYIK